MTESLTGSKRNFLKMKFTKKHKYIFIPLVVSVILVATIFLFLKDQQKSSVENKEVEVKKELPEYKIKGIDISRYQGDIDFKKVKEDNISFVFAKATEGLNLVDKKFSDNLDKGNNQDLKIGAYHFYRLCENGAKQAQHFIKNVDKNKISLPPVLDLETYRNCRSKEGIEWETQELLEFFNLIKNHYQTKPIIYTSIDTYHEFKNLFFERLGKEDYLLWARVTDRHIDSNNYENIFGLENETEIRKIIQKDWSFWQACDTCRVSGIDGPVDVNYFRGEKLP